MRRLLTCIGVAALGVLAPHATAFAQSEESEPAPLPGQFEPAAQPPQENPLVPDLPDSVAGKLQARKRLFTLKVGLVLIADYTAFGQDAASISQVGTQRDQWDDRAARLMLRGTAGPAFYLVAAEYKGFDTDPTETWQLTDLSVTLPLGGPETKLTIGKTKETFAYEMVGDAANLPPQERVLSPFFVSRNVGVKVSRVMGRQHRMTASAGVFNDWWLNEQKLATSGTDGSARVTGLAWAPADTTRYLHRGLSTRYYGADDNAMRYEARPESNVAGNYLDTGTLSADHAWHTGFEVLWGNGPFSLLAEYNTGHVLSASSGSPTFGGGYLAASYVLTGESRPYNRTVGCARRVMPRGRWGAPEIVLRDSHVDLEDGVVHGGEFDKTHLGLNWWATRRWKFGVGLGGYLA